jgi:O-antigen ligase
LISVLCAVPWRFGAWGFSWFLPWCRSCRCRRVCWAALSPFRFAVVSRAAALLGEGAGGHALGYVAPAAFAWWVFLLSLVLFFVVLRAHLTQTRHLAAVVGVMLGVALLLALYGLIQVLIPTMGVLWAGTEAYLGYARGTFINRNHLAGFIEMVWPLGLGWLLAMAHVSRRERSGHKGGVKQWKHLLSSDRTGLQLLVWAALVFILLALLFSKSRAGIAGALIGFAAFIVLVRLGGKRFSKPAWAGIGLGCGVLLFYGYVIGFGEVIGRFLMIDAQMGARAPIWIGTIAMIGDHPLGVGLDNYEHVIPVFNALGPYGIKYTHAHNDYLQLLAEAGWPGFITLVGGFYVFVGRCIRRLRKFGPDMDPVRFYIGIGACSGLISIAFHSLFDFNLQIPANLLYFVVLLGIASACFRRSPERVLNGSPLERPEKAAGASRNGKSWRFF